MSCARLAVATVASVTADHCRARSSRARLSSAARAAAIAGASQRLSCARSEVATVASVAADHCRTRDSRALLSSAARAAAAAARYGSPSTLLQRRPSSMAARRCPLRMPPHLFAVLFSISKNTGLRRRPSARQSPAWPRWRGQSVPAVGPPHATRGLSRSRNDFKMLGFHSGRTVFSVLKRGRAGPVRAG